MNAPPAQPVNPPPQFQQPINAPPQFQQPINPPPQFQQPINPPPQFQQPVNPIPPQQPVQQAPALILPEEMKKAADVYKRVGEFPAKSELRKNHIEDQYEEMLAILNNDPAAYEKAKAQRLAKPAAAAPPQRTAPAKFAPRGPAAPPNIPVHRPPPTAMPGPGPR